MASVVHIFIQTILQEWTTILFSLLVFLIIKYWWTRPKLPPGPTLIPCIGIIPGYVGSFDPDTVRKYAKEYNSDIISVRVLGTLTVVLNSYDLIREVFAIRKDVIDRCSNIWQLVSPNHRGIMVHSGPTWAITNRTLRRMIRDFGFDRGNTRPESLLIEEVEHMVEMMRKHNGQPFDPDFIINGSECNIMMQLLLSKPVEYDDKEMSKAISSLTECQCAIWGTFGEYVLGNNIGRTLWKDYYKTLLKRYAEFVEMPHREVDKHVKRFNGEVHDICDGFLHYMKTAPGLGEDFDIPQLKNVITDLVEASIESVKVELHWFLLYMAVHPDVQEKCHEEVKEHTGDRTPNYDDHKKTLYLTATMYELLRCHIELPFGVQQCCKDHDIEIRGYTIPKGTPIAANYTWLNENPAMWKKSNEFYPENFIENGKLANVDKMASFSIGRRACVGEPLAKVHMYVYFASWVKYFKIRMPEGVEADFEPIEGTPYAKPYKICMIPRK